MMISKKGLVKITTGPTFAKSCTPLPTNVTAPMKGGNEGSKRDRGPQFSQIQEQNFEIENKVLF